MGTLYLVSTPIGNLEDITIRALKTLFSVDIIACEDTRVTGQLLELLKKKYASFLPSDKKPAFISYRDTNEQSIAAELIHKLELQKNVALVSDAGTPLVSDPGFRIVTQAQKRNIPIVVVPGVSAFLTALTGSGLPANTFTFLGYLPEKQGKRIAELKNIHSHHSRNWNSFNSGNEDPLPSRTYIVYVAPHKLLQTLDDMEEVFGNISLVLARELTKLHEEYWRGTIKEALVHFPNPQGEIVILFRLLNTPQA